MATLKNIPIFSAGEHGLDEQGHRIAWTEKDLDSMQANFERHVLGAVNPPVVIGHAEQSDIMRQSGIPAVGIIEKIWRAGRDLMADIANVPDTVAKLIKAKAYTYRSPEIYRDFGGHGPTLRRLALLGGEIPEVKSLPQLANLFSEPDDADATVVCLFRENQSIINKQEEKGMDITKVRKALKSAKCDDLLALSDEVLVKALKENHKVETADDLAIFVAEKFANMKPADEPIKPDATKPAPTPELVAMQETIKNLNEKIGKMESGLTAAQTAAEKEGIVKFAEALQAEGKLTPAMKSEILADMTTAKPKLDCIKKYGRKVVNFGESIRDTKDKTKEGEEDKEKKNRFARQAPNFEKFRLGAK